MYRQMTLNSKNYLYYRINKNIEVLNRYGPYSNPRLYTKVK